MLVRWFFIFLCPFTHALAQELSGIQEYRKSSEDSSIVQLFTKQADSIKYLGSERIYLNPSHVFPTRVGFVVCNGHSAIVFAGLSADQHGYYLSCRSRDDFKLRCSNSECNRQWWFSDTWSIYCPLCGSIGN